MKRQHEEEDTPKPATASGTSARDALIKAVWADDVLAVRALVAQADTTSSGGVWRDSALWSVQDSECAMDGALEHHNAGMVLLLIEAGVVTANTRPEWMPGSWTTPLQQAVNMRNYRLFRCLLEHGADVNATSSAGNTALTCAVFNLCDVAWGSADAKPRRYGEAPVSAPTRGDTKFLDDLLANGADPNKTCKNTLLGTNTLTNYIVSYIHSTDPPVRPQYAANAEHRAEWCASRLLASGLRVTPPEVQQCMRWRVMAPQLLLACDTSAPEMLPVVSTLDPAPTITPFSWPSYAWHNISGIWGTWGWGLTRDMWTLLLEHGVPAETPTPILFDSVTETDTN